MKKYLSIFLLIVSLFVFCGCRENKELLFYQNDNIIAHCRVNDKYDIIINKMKDFSRINISSPAELEGVSFELYCDNAIAISEDMKIPIEKENLMGMYALVNSFALREESKTDSFDRNGLGVFVFENGYGRYEITYSKESLPCHIEIEGINYSYSIDITNFELY